MCRHGLSLRLTRKAKRRKAPLELEAEQYSLLVNQTKYVHWVNNYVIAILMIDVIQTPVQKWQTADVESHRIEKSKHVYIEVGGPSPTSLHYSAGSKDIAEAIIAKLDSSKRASSSSPTPRSPSPRAIKTPSPVYDSEPEDEPTPARESPKLKKNGVNVHFATSPPSIISPREPSEDGDADIYQHTNGHSKVDDGQEWVTVLYDFEADGVDELSVHEGDRLVVLERDNDEWWKVRDMEGNEGVVPASYVELDVVDQVILSPYFIFLRYWGFV